VLALKLKTLIETTRLSLIHNQLVAARFLRIYLNPLILIETKIRIRILIFLASSGLSSSNTQRTDLILIILWSNNKNIVKDLNLIIAVLKGETSTLLIAR
jgi:hypothetical protein